MFETKGGIFMIAGLGMFALAFLVMGVVPWTIYRDQPELTVDQLARQGIVPEFVDLAERFPDRFKKYFGQPDYNSFARALQLGHDVYVAEACWHCHSQQIRPVSQENLRWGRVSYAGEYTNVLQRPVLLGTRRVGPDLIREGGRRTNDWHIAHFFKPTEVAPLSVMPSYPWLFDEEYYPNERGMALITYVQWLGSWLDEYPYYEEGATGDGAPKSETASGSLAEGSPAHPASPEKG